MDLNLIKENLSKILIKDGYKLYDVSYSKKDKILQVLIDNDLNLNEIEELSKKISKYMDDYDDEFDSYLLDVGTVGIERAINNEDELLKAVGSYICLTVNKKKVYGTLVKFENGKLSIDVLEKNIKKNMNIDYCDAKNIRYAVKF